MAEDWGTPPWEIEEADGSLWWAARWSLYRQEQSKASEDRLKASRKGDRGR